MRRAQYIHGRDCVRVGLYSKHRRAGKSKERSQIYAGRKHRKSCILEQMSRERRDEYRVPARLCGMVLWDVEEDRVGSHVDALHLRTINSSKCGRATKAEE